LSKGVMEGINRQADCQDKSESETVHNDKIGTVSKSS